MQPNNVVRQSKKKRNDRFSIFPQNNGTFNKEPIQNTYFKRVVKWCLGGEENYGSEDFLVNARNILIRLKLSQDEEYAEKRNEERRKKIAEKTEKRMKLMSDKINTLSDSILNIENRILGESKFQEKHPKLIK